MDKINIFGDEIELTNEDIVDALTIEILLKMKYGFGYYPSYQNHLECSLCLDDLHNKTVLITSCKHVFHLECMLFSIMEFNHLKCPTCEKKYIIQNNDD